MLDRRISECCANSRKSSTLGRKLFVDSERLLLTFSERVEVRPLDSSELGGVVELFDVVWPTKAGHLERTNWAFAANPLGRVPLVGAIDIESGAIVGVRGAIRWPLGGGGVPLPMNAVQMHGTCVHPAYRRMGLFTRMNREFIRQAQGREIELIFNVSVAASRAGYEKLGWCYLPGFRAYHRIERPGRLIGTLLKRKKAQSGLVDRAESHVDPLSRPDYSTVRSFLDERSVRLGDLKHTVYAEPFFDWRFSNSDHRIVGTDKIGYCVYRMRLAGGLRDLLIGDLWPARGRTAALLAEAIGMERADTATIWMSVAHPLRSSLVAQRFVPDLRRSLNFGVKAVGRRSEALLSKSRWGSVSADIDTF